MSYTQSDYRLFKSSAFLKLLSMLLKMTVKYFKEINDNVKKLMLVIIVILVELCHSQPINF